MKIGVRAEDFGRRRAQEMAALLRDEEYETAELNLLKAVEGIRNYRDITLKRLREIRSAFEAQRVGIGVLSCPVDLSSPDPLKREAAVRILKESFSWARELGAAMVGTETAPGALTEAERQKRRPFAQDSILRVLEEAARLNVRLSLIPSRFKPIGSLEEMMELAGQAGCPEYLRLTLKGEGLLKKASASGQSGLWRQWLWQAGPYIDALFLTDFSLDRQRRRQPEPLGMGLMDYGPLKSWLPAQGREIFLIREEMNLMFAKDDIGFMRRLGAEGME